MRDPLVPLIDHLPESTLAFELPTPFPVGPVNCYVLLEEPVTVVDPGMLFGDTIATAEAFLKLLPMLKGKGLVTFGDVLAEVRKHGRLLKDLNG